jgi:3'-5' exonuclease
LAPMAWPVLVFDLETVPDVEGLRRLGLGPALVDDVRAETAALASDAEVFAHWKAQRAASGKSDFAPLHLQRIVCASMVYRGADGLKVHSLVDRDGQGEARLIQQFFTTVERNVPQLVSWNGGGFDLPVLHHRGLIHGVEATQYWEMGEGGDSSSREFKWNNYISRYHLRHLDLMDLLSLYQGKGAAPLDAMAKLCGFPGKLGMDGSKVYEAYLQGQIEDIRRYCETDVMNTYLLYCRFQKMRGGFTATEYNNEIAFVKETLAQIAEPHWAEYLRAWGD